MGKRSNRARQARVIQHPAARPKPLPLPRRVRIAVPCYGGVAPPFVRSFALAVAAMVANGIEANFDFHVGNSLITHARSRLLANFLASDDDVLFFIDSDLGFAWQDFIRVLASPDDMAVACYPVKKPDVEFAVGMIADEHGRPVRRADGFVQVAHAGTGFMKLTRRWAERMIAAYPETRYTDTDGTVCHALFDTQVIDGRFWGEDYVACHRWTAIGGEIWAWPDATFEHVGTRSWTGNLHEYLIALSKPAAAAVSDAA